MNLGEGEFQVVEFSPAFPNQRVAAGTFAAQLR